MSGKSCVVWALFSVIMAWRMYTEVGVPMLIKLIAEKATESKNAAHPARLKRSAQASSMPCTSRLASTATIAELGKNTV